MPYELLPMVTFRLMNGHWHKMGVSNGHFFQSIYVSGGRLNAEYVTLPVTLHVLLLISTQELADKSGLRALYVPVCNCVLELHI